VVITTKNRKAELAKAVRSVLEQTVRTRVLVMDDGSTDGTAEAIARDFPSVRVNQSAISAGYIAQRNRAAQLADTDILFSIDDDASFSSPRIVEQTLLEFDHPRVGAVAIPFVNANRSGEVHHRAPCDEGVYARCDFIGTAHALRRDLFLRLSGYREILFHQSEEEDYCARLLNAGYITRCGRAEPVHHFESPRRSWKRMDYYGARNKALYAWHNVPFPYLPAHLAVSTVLTSAYSLRPDRLLTRLRGVLAAYALICAGKARRQPVTVATYKLIRELKRRGSMPLPDLEDCLPACHTGGTTECCHADEVIK
jgi:glycosyltransferase involved in cell wall biosynthesis